MPNQIIGIGVSPGRVVGPALRMAEAVSEPDAAAILAPSEREAEAARIAPAAARVAEDLTARAQRASGEAKDVLDATALMAADPALADAARAAVLDHGRTASRGVWEAAEDVARTLTAAGGYLAERARDVRDVRDRIVAVLDGRQAPGIPTHPEPFVLVARDLAPADTATLDAGAVLALVTEEGGPTSHTAILARALGLPAVVAASGITDLRDGTPVLVDGTDSVVIPDPDPDVSGDTPPAAPPEPFAGHGQTSDGVHVALLANVGDPRSTSAAVDVGAEGIGLFRTEFCFLDRTEPPSFDEQVAAYRSVFSQFSARKVVVRTLDAGADKPLPFLTVQGEPNPALGVRGLRTARQTPSLLDDQLRAISSAARETDAEVWVMAPMVATAAEATAFVARARAHDLGTVGVMVEVPSAAVTADAVVAACDFVSIGTNDLAQYTLAADRQLGELAELTDPWQPALLRLVKLIGAAGRRAGKPVGVCGEAASDPLLAAVLVGLGVSSLSMSARAIPPVATSLAAVSHDVCLHLAEIAVEAADPADARRRVRAAVGT